MKKILIAVSILILAALACNVPGSSPNGETPAITQPLEQSPSLATAGGAAPATPTIVLLAATQAGAAQPAPVITETDPCKMLSREKAEEIMGMPVMDILPSNTGGINLCSYITEGYKKSIMIEILSANTAKKNLINEILQYQKGCNISYSGGTSTATPFPPEGQTLMSKTILELLAMDQQLGVSCGNKIEPLPEFGPNAFTVPGAFPGVAAVELAYEDKVYYFVYGETGGEMAGMMEKAKIVARAVLLK